MRTNYGLGIVAKLLELLQKIHEGITLRPRVNAHCTRQCTTVCQHVTNKFLQHRLATLEGERLHVDNHARKCVHTARKKNSSPLALCDGSGGRGVWGGR